MPSPLFKPLLKRIPLVGPLLMSNKYLDMYSPEQQKKLQEDYRNALGLGENVSFSDTAFETLVKAKKQDYKSFTETKGPDGKPILEKLNATPKDEKEANTHTKNVVFIKQTFDKILEPTPAFTKAQADYKESVATFKDLVKLIPSKYQAEQLIGTMQELQDEAIKAIQAQHKHEMDKFEELFVKDDAANLKDTYTEALGLKSPEEYDAVRDSMKKELEDSHAKQLKEFKDSTTESMNTLHRAAAAQMSKLLFIARLYESNATMHKRIDDIAASNRQRDNISRSTSLTVGIKKDSLSLYGVNLEDLGTIKSLTGKTITRNEDGSYSFPFRNSVFDFLYNQDPRQNPKSDLLLLAQAIRASGFDTITYDIEYQPIEDAMERARQAYEAAVESGFTPQQRNKGDKDVDHIIIKVNGEAMRIDKLFEGHPERLQRLESKSAQIQKELKELTDFKPKGPLDTAGMKAEINKLRTEAKAKEALAEDETPEDQVSLTTTNPS